MSEKSGPLAAERQFFAALIEGNVEALNQLLADDFILIDVLSGSEIAKASLLSALESGQLKFEAIEPADSRVRLYQGTAVVTGRTKLSGRFGDAAFAARSRYTHVYVQQEDHWRLLAAQGTQIAGE